MHGNQDDARDIGRGRGRRGTRTVQRCALSEPGNPAAVGPSASAARIVTVDDGGVNDNGQTSGDIFTQNAQDQSTASGAGT